MMLLPNKQNHDRIEKSNRWLPLLSVTGLTFLVGFQAFAYFCRLTLSLGSRVILEPWILGQGFVLYENIADMHSPLMPLVISWLRFLVPDGLLLAKLVLVTLVSTSTLLVFLAARRVSGWLGGLWAAWFFVMWSPTFDFGKLWYENFLTPLYALLLLCFKPGNSRRSTGSLVFFGLVGGIALLIKQHSIVVILSLFLWAAVSNISLRRPVSECFREIVILGLAMILPVLAFTVYQYFHAGTLKGFLYWTVGFMISSPFRTLISKWPSFQQVQVVLASSLLLVVALVYLIDLKRKGDNAWLDFGWGLVLCAAGSFSVYPRFEYFHLQAVLPAVAYLSSRVIFHAWRSSRRNRVFIKGIALALSVFWLIWGVAAFSPIMNDPKAQRIAEYSDLKPLARELGRYCGSADNLYVFPDDEQTANLYYLTGHLPPRFWIFHYPWNMIDSIKSRILSVLRKQPPEWVVYFPGRQMQEKYAPEILEYLQIHYRKKARLRWPRGKVLLLKRWDSG